MCNIVVDPAGMIRFIYQDDLKPLLAVGTSRIRRASHVEPSDDGSCRWTADMSPVQGPMLGPFNSRQEALRAEVQFLNDTVL